MIMYFLVIPYVVLKNNSTIYFLQYFMTDIKNKLHITEKSKGNLENDFDKSEEMVEAFKNLPSNPEEIMRQAAEIQKQKTIAEKEKVEEIPELEDKNFSIDSTHRKEITSLNWVKVLKNPGGDVREYVEGDYKGEQLFTYGATLRETKKAGKKLPSSWTIYKDIIEKKYKGNYQDFLKGEKMLFTGWYGQNIKEFGNINERFYLRCSNRSNFVWTVRENGVDSDDALNDIYGYSVRCLKSG